VASPKNEKRFAVVDAVYRDLAYNTPALVEGILKKHGFDEEDLSQGDFYSVVAASGLSLFLRAFLMVKQQYGEELATAWLKHTLETMTDSKEWTMCQDVMAKLGDKLRG
jgi:hypothetical protein